MSVRIITADVMEGLAQLPDGSVHCVCTSPPYWGLRDYGTGRWEGGAPDCDHRSPTMREGRNEERPNLAGSVATNSAQLLLAHASACGKCGAVKVDRQIGLEPTPEAFVAKMVEVFREARRVLRKDGTLWLNMGDAYATSPPGNKTVGVSAKSTLHGVNGPSDAYRETLANSVQQKRNTVVGGLKPKDLIGMPWMVAFALRADGWWLRGDYIWAKSNPMPESVRDRCTKAHEYIFHLAKSERYYWDAEAIKETALWPEGANAPDKIKSPYGQGFTRANIGAKGNANTFRGGSYVNGKPGPRTVSGNTKRTRDCRADAISPGARSQHSLSDFEAKSGGEYASRNKRSVWEVATAPFAEAHFATFPPALVEPMILAGCPAGGMVLDCFAGAGTALMVADRLGRDAIGIELNPEYAAMAERRIARDRLERGQYSMEQVAKAKLPPTPLEALMQEDAFDSPDGRTHSEDGAT